MKNLNVVAAAGGDVGGGIPPEIGDATITATDTGSLTAQDVVNFTILTDPGTTPPDPGDDRDDDAGIYLIWYQWNGPEIDLPIVKGNQVRASIVSYVNDGDYDNPFSETSDWQLERHWTSNTGTPQGDKRGSLQISSKKDENWKKHVWYANDAEGRGASKFEDPTPPNDWIGAYWTPDGHDVHRGIFDLVTEYYDNLTQDRKDRVIGIRCSANFIGVEGTKPGSILENTSSYVRGSQASASRPPNYSAAREDEAFIDISDHILDTAFPNGDTQPAIYPIFYRATWLTFVTSLIARVEPIINDKLMGLFVTSSEHEPGNNTHENSSQLIISVAKKQGGNTKIYMEGFGRFPGNNSLDGNYTMIQMLWWRILHDLHCGASYIAIRDEYVGQYGTSTEMTISLDFCAKYAGYQQFPFRSPGAWVAFREGNQLAGNYDFLATQLVSANAARGSELRAGDDHIGPQNGYVGPPSNSDNNNNITGEGDRQSLWAFDFDAGDMIKVQLDINFASTLEGIQATVRVHHLDDSNGSSFQVSAFNNVLGTVNVGNTRGWIETEFVIPSVSVAFDGEGAHVVIDVIGGSIRFHMIEVEKV